MAFRVLGYAQHSGVLSGFAGEVRFRHFPSTRLEAKSVKVRTERVFFAPAARRGSLLLFVLALL
jgi:hypothetical protein